MYTYLKADLILREVRSGFGFQDVLKGLFSVL